MDSKVLCSFIRYYLRDDECLGIPYNVDDKEYDRILRLLFPEIPFDKLNLEPGGGDWKGEHIELSSMIPKKYERDTGYLLSSVFGDRSKVQEAKLELTLRRILNDYN